MECGWATPVCESSRALSSCFIQPVRCKSCDDVTLKNSGVQSMTPPTNGVSKDQASDHSPGSRIPSTCGVLPRYALKLRMVSRAGSAGVVPAGWPQRRAKTIMRNIVLRLARRWKCQKYIVHIISVDISTPEVVTNMLLPSTFPLRPRSVCVQRAE